MSRARNIKPGFFKNELLVELPFEVRLLFIGLWTLADREGRLEDRPVRIKMEIFPADSVDVNGSLDSLHRDGFIERYAVGNAKYIQILAWKKHQNPHCKEAESTIPAPCEHHASPADSLIPDSLIRDISNPNGLDVAANAGDLPSGDTDESKGAKDAAQPAGRCPLQKIVDLYHDALPMCPKVEKLTDTRAGYLRQRWREDLPTLEAWRNYFTDVSRSPFLTGRAPGRDGKPPFVADLEWLTRPGNFAKVAEGRYHR